MEYKSELKWIVSSGVEMIANISGAAVGAAIAGPAGMVIGASLPTVLNSMFKKISSDVASRNLGERETQKIGAGYYYALKRIDQNISIGKELRKDGFIDESDVLSDSSIILEGVTTKLQREWELKKLIFYGNFLGNISFEESIDFDYATVLLKLIDNLSYRQLCLIAVFKRCGTPEIDLSSIGGLFKEREWNNKFDYALYSDLVDLSAQSILQPIPPFSLGDTLGNSILSDIGDKLYSLMNLNELEERDYNVVKHSMEDILNRRL